LPSPVRLNLNPVWRSYAGGSVLRAFRGRGHTPDDHFPEDWLASVVRARNGANSQRPDEGLSRLADDGSEGETFAKALQENPVFWFGARQAGRNGMGVLWKLLDSSVRLQFQAHPDAAFASKYLQSDAGKTECWYILATRGQACVYLGFQQPPTRAAWGRMIREQQVEQMLGCFERIDVKAGDCYVVPAGTPHAIGAGVFMVELMEPTDWVVRCETAGTGVTVSSESCFMGLELECCLDVFDYRAYSVEQVRRAFQQPPRVLRATAECVEEELIAPTWHGYFRLHRLRGGGEATWPGGELQLLIAISGEGELSAGESGQRVDAGQAWLLPGAAGEWRWRNLTTSWEVLLAKLPETPAAGAYK
jgi:mannose-6-phosphate isomerase